MNNVGDMKEIRDGYHESFWRPGGVRSSQLVPATSSVVVLVVLHGGCTPVEVWGGGATCVQSHVMRYRHIQSWDVSLTGVPSHQIHEFPGGDSQQEIRLSFWQNVHTTAGADTCRYGPRII